MSPFEAEISTHIRDATYLDEPRDLPLAGTAFWPQTFDVDAAGKRVASADYVLAAAVAGTVGAGRLSLYEAGVPRGTALPVTAIFDRFREKWPVDRWTAATWCFAFAAGAARVKGIAAPPIPFAAPMLPLRKRRFRRGPSAAELEEHHEIARAFWWDGLACVAPAKGPDGVGPHYWPSEHNARLLVPEHLEGWQVVDALKVRTSLRSLQAPSLGDAVTAAERSGGSGPLARALGMLFVLLDTMERSGSAAWPSPDLRVENAAVVAALTGDDALVPSQLVPENT